MNSVGKGGKSESPTRRRRREGKREVMRSKESRKGRVSRLEEE